LVLPYMLGLDVISFSISMLLLFYYFIFFFNKKKKLVEKMQNFIFSLDSFSNIACIFA
jgi:hypothetical protein